MTIPTRTPGPRRIAARGTSIEVGAVHVIEANPAAAARTVQNISAHRVYLDAGRVGSALYLDAGALVRLETGEALNISNLASAPGAAQVQIWEELE